MYKQASLQNWLHYRIIKDKYITPLNFNEDCICLEKHYYPVGIHYSFIWSFNNKDSLAL